MLTVKFSDEIEKEVSDGKLVLLATVFYVPETDSLKIFFPKSGSIEECAAMLRKYGCFPELKEE